MSVDQSNVWEYNCPQFVDLQKCDDNNLDSYFETDHENGTEIRSPGMQIGVIHKKCNFVQPDLTVKQELKTGKIDDSFTRFKKQNYASGKEMNAEKQEEYTLRLTPFRETRAKSYCCVYQNKDNEVLDSKIMLGGTNSKSYDLRMTPARKKRTKSCSTFHKQDLESNKHNIKCCGNRLYSENKKKGDSAMTPSDLGLTELKTVIGKNSRKALIPVTKGKKANILKRSSSLEATDFPIKRPRFTFHSKIENVIRKPVKSVSNHRLLENTRKNMLLKSRQKTVVMKKTFAEHLPSTSVAPSSKCTVIKPFHFETDARIKDHKIKEEYKKMDFFSSLRTTTLKQSKLVCKATKPEPFNFSQTKRKKLNSDQTCEEIHNESSKSNKSRNLVQPRSPNLLAVKRNRRVSYVGQEIKDDMEASALKKWKFQAKPINPCIFNQPALPKIENKPPTKPERKSLATEKRFRNKVDKSQSDDEGKYEFRAQPFPKKMFFTPGGGANGINRRSKLQPTEPKSPTFALKARSQKWKEHANTIKEKTKKVEKHFKAKSIPDFHAPSSFKIEKKYTVLEPFTFDEKDKLRQTRKEQKIQEKIEKDKQVAKFKANPLPSVSYGSTSSHTIAKRPSTKPVPFNFQITQMGSEAAAKWQKEIETQLEVQKKVAMFKAQPSTIVKKPPFLPDKSLKPLTVCNAFQLSTERRASQWVKFEESMKAKQAENEAKQLLLQAEKEQKENEEIAQLRKETVHHANPVRHYKAFDLKPSEKQVTTPVSPNFATRLRLRERV